MEACHLSSRHQPAGSSELSFLFCFEGLGFRICRSVERAFQFSGGSSLFADLFGALALYTCMHKHVRIHMHLL